uniref:hypothetical protein n=1 Tax=Echinothamnion hookeri TaxID=2008680 RepID=UPI002551F1AB|nr:hypothetical protein QQP88_pgp020 [Echinothamnion hookeri]WGH14361.1 hypothetical protein [Echinothamnion hookeri]
MTIPVLGIAEASTPKVSSICLTSSAASNKVKDFNSSIILSILLLILNLKINITNYKLPCFYIFKIFKSTGTPGPIVLDKYKDFQYLPLEPLGRFLSTDSCKAFRFKLKSSIGKLSLPIGTCTIPVRSTLYSNLPALNSLIELLNSLVTVPDLGEGINPLGPKKRPNFAISNIISGVAINLSKSKRPLKISSIKSSEPTKSAPAAIAVFILSP